MLQRHVHGEGLVSSDHQLPRVKKCLAYSSSNRVGGRAEGPQVGSGLQLHSVPALFAAVTTS